MKKFLALSFLAVLGGLSIGSLFFSSEMQASLILQAPSAQHWLGTDSLGRDLLLRLLEGSRISLLLGLSTTFMTFALGLIYAITAHKLGGWLDSVMMRLTEVLMALPSIILIAVMVLFFSNLWVGTGLMSQIWILALSLTLTSWMPIARQARTWIGSQAHMPYVEAERALGATSSRILWRHILPNLSGTILIYLGLQIPQHLLFESFLSFVGLGIQPPHASWGVLIQEGWKTLSVYPWLILVPSTALFLTVLSFNLLFEDLRK